MKTLKTILPFKVILIFLITCFYVWYITSNSIYTTHYDDSFNTVTGIIERIDIDGNRVDIILRAKEKIRVNYFLNSLEEKEEFSNKRLGDYIKVTGEFIKPSTNTVFNLFNYQRFLKSRGIYWIIRATRIEHIENNNKFHYNIKNLINDRLIDLKSGPYIKTFILGDSGLLDREIVTSYQLNGVSHLLAISGMHINLLSGILYFLLNKVNKKYKTNFILISIFLLFYAFLASFSPSVLRAVILFMAVGIRKILKLKIKTSTIIVLIACALLIYNPYYIYNIGFLFSFIISFYLSVFSYKINSCKNYISKVFIVSVIAFLASIPIMINNFYSINLLSPIMNIIFVPFVSLIIFPLSLVVLIFPFLDNFYYLLIVIMENLSLALANLNYLTLILRHIPIYLILSYYVIITYSIYKNKFVILIICLFIHTNIRYINPNAYLTMLEVGQGDSLILELEHNKGVIVIDTGGIVNFNTEDWQQRSRPYSIVRSKTIPYMKSIGIKRIEYLIITHGHFDHIGEARNLINSFPVKNIIMNSGIHTEESNRLIELANNKNIPILFLSQDNLNIGGYDFQFINPRDYTNINEDSLVLYTKIQDRHILFMGDAGHPSERQILAEYNLPKIDILKVGHHGSRNSSKEEFLDKINPNLALISAGLNNRFNHPHSEVMDALKIRDIFVLVTSIDGSIRINLNNFKVYTCSRVYANC